MLANFNKPIIPYYSPISAKGGRRRTRRNKRRGKYSRTKRRYH